MRNHIQARGYDNGKPVHVAIPDPRDGTDGQTGDQQPGIGDITSAAKGSGARFNAGKPDLSLIPLAMLASTLRTLHGEIPCVGAMGLLGEFQTSHEEQFLDQALEALGFEGWGECAHVFTYGKKKYAAWNWAKGMPWSVPLACAARHLLSMAGGKGFDAESGETERGHVYCNIVMLKQYIKTYPEGNDLPPKGLL